MAVNGSDDSIKGVHEHDMNTNKSMYMVIMVNKVGINYYIHYSPQLEV